MTSKQINLTSLPVLILSFFAFGLVFTLTEQRANAVTASDWKAGRIIDDGVFTNAGSMTPQQIQDFLTARVPTCDTNGTKMTTRWNSAAGRNYTRAEWGAKIGYPAPFTCLRDFWEVPKTTPSPGQPANNYGGKAIPSGAKSAAQIIYDAAQAYNISPKVILVTIQKESYGPLTSDEWPLSYQYQFPLGARCPDGPNGAECDPNYEGFSIQVYESARLFRYYLDSMGKSWWPYKRPHQNNYVLWNVSTTSCGGSDVYIETSATAALYTYTPYQPNAAALANMSGTGDGCSAYGNRNFWRIFNDWFGPPTASDSYWSLIREPSTGKVYIATEFAVHYVPTPQILTDWGLSNTQPNDVTSQFISSRTLGSPVNRLLRDRFGNIFLMDGGKRHYVRDKRYLQLWQQDINSAITVNGLIFNVPDGEWLGHCGKSISNSNNVWVINATNKYAASAPLQVAWGCDTTNTTTLTDNLLASLPSAGNANYFAMNDSTPFVVNQGLLWTNNDQSIINYYKPASESYTNLDSRLRQLLNWKTITPFARDMSTQEWFYVENGSKHYISSSKLADLWGITENGGLSSLSNDLLGTLTSAADLSSLARTAMPNRYYLIGGDKKHYVPNQTAIDEWSKPGTFVLLLPNNVLDRYPEGADIYQAAGKSGSGSYFLAQEGQRLELWQPNLKDAWANSYVPVSDKLYSYLDPSGGAGFVAKNGANYFYLEAGTKYSIPATLGTSWGFASSSTILPQTLARYTLGSKIMTPFVSLNGHTHSLLNFQKTELSGSLVGIIPKTQVTNLQKDYFPTNTNKGTYILRSSNLADTRLWLAGLNGKLLLPSTAHALNLGYISKSVELTVMAPEALDAIPTSTTVASLLIQSPSGALKLLSFGEALSLPDGQTAQAYIDITGSVSQVSQEIFNLFPVSRNATRLIRDDYGKVYWIDNGTKRWVVNGARLSTTFAGVSQTYLHSTAASLIPDGTVIN